MSEYPGGLSFKDFREVIRNIRNDSPFVHEYNREYLMSKIRLTVPPGLQSAVLTGIIANYTTPVSGGRTQKFAFTDTAIQLGTKRLTRIKPDTLERAKRAIIDRARASANQDYSPLEVKMMAFFGSAIGPAKADYGDLDVVVVPGLKKRYHDDWDAVWADIGRPNLNWYPESELEKYLRARNSVYHFTSMGHIKQFKIPIQIVYQSDDYEGDE